MSQISKHEKLFIQNAVYASERGFIKVVWDENGEDDYPSVWLRDNCPCKDCFNGIMFSRLFEIKDLDIDVKPKQIKVENSALNILWSDDHNSTYTAAWLGERSFKRDARSARVQENYLEEEKILWGKDLLTQLPTFDYEEVINQDRCLYKFLVSLEIYGVVMVKNAGSEPGACKGIGKRVAYLRETEFGKTFKMRTKIDPKDISYSGSRLQLHTDLAYVEKSPGVVMLHCIQQCKVDGGDTQLADGFYAARKLKDENLDAFRALSSTPVDYFNIGFEEHYGKFFTRARGPIIKLDEDGQIVGIRFSPHSRDNTMNIPANQVHSFYQAMLQFARILNDPENHIQYKMNEGDLFIVDNRRVLHGRAPFSAVGDGGQRFLEGAFLEWDEIHARIRLLKENL